METSALESLNVENAFTEVLTQIYRVVSRKALDIGDDTAALPKGQTINVGKDDVYFFVMWCQVTTVIRMLAQHLMVLPHNTLLSMEACIAMVTLV
ncbi:Ras-related protein raba1f [Thalictrum thalictroides]|uniref:Ras-related protein raba1f n=1 Tax=Thalictrum thalictroides TaxID=46969 RepID=A0A7J6V5F8_THATH|nr:Ras-related protein raba1f [Thalictrum thalictroides]